MGHLDNKERYPKMLILLTYYLATDIFLGKKVLALVVEDDMDLLGSRSTDVRPKHDHVWGITMEIFLVKIGREDLDVATSTVDVLFVLNLELDYQGFTLVAESLIKFGTESVELGILAGLDSLIVFISVEFASCLHKLALVSLVC